MAGEEVFAVGQREDGKVQIRLKMKTNRTSFPEWTVSAALDPGKYKYVLPFVMFGLGMSTWYVCDAYGRDRPFTCLYRSSLRENWLLSDLST
jgi:hypothetical protein